MTKSLQKLKPYLPFILITIYFSLFYLVFINLFNSDLGRHLTNGREIIHGSLANIKSLLTTNYYSYTQTNYPNINHHWLFGVIVYLVQQLGGFKLLTILNLILNTLAFAFLLLNSLIGIDKRDRLAINTVTVTAFFTIPLLSHRLEVRPESFSLLFFSTYYFLFNSKLVTQHKYLIGLLFITQVIWVNTHLFFILGPLLAVYFLLKETLTLINKKLTFKQVLNHKTTKFWLKVVLILFIATLFNPNFINGSIQPFKIFSNYGYRVAENQSSIAMIKYGANIKFFSYLIFFSITSFTILTIKLLKQKKDKNLALLKLVLVSSFLLIANKINRMTPFLAIIITPVLAKLAYQLLKKYYHKLFTQLNLVITSSVVSIILIIALSLQIFTPKIRLMGLGLLPRTFLATDFFLKNELKGPIFNNYDIGSYLIYSLFPKEKLFIDNRPEAYSNQFLQNTFLTALKDETTWKKIDKQYQFNTIFFYRHDMIDNAQSFLYERISDTNWVPVFVDDYTLILVKNNQDNQAIINNYQLSSEIFNLKETN